MTGNFMPIFVHLAKFISQFFSYLTNNKETAPYVFLTHNIDCNI